MKLLRLFFLSACFLNLTAAKSVFDYSYLMTHPNTLEKEFKRCQSALDESCTSVNQAAQDFVKLVAERRDNPQAFGKTILQNQMFLSNLEEQLNQVEKNSTEFSKLKQAYNNQLQKVNTLLSVVAATTVL